MVTLIDIRHGWGCNSVLEVCCRNPRPTPPPTPAPEYTPAPTSPSVTAQPGFTPQCGTLNPNGIVNLAHSLISSLIKSYFFYNFWLQNARILGFTVNACWILINFFKYPVDTYIQSYTGVNFIRNDKNNSIISSA